MSGSLGLESLYLAILLQYSVLIVDRISGRFSSPFLESPLVELKFSFFLLLPLALILLLFYLAGFYHLDDYLV